MKVNRAATPDRPNPSKVLSEIRKTSRRAFDLLPPERRMEAAFVLSQDARKMRIAGLRAQGFTESSTPRLRR
ncbi:MAG: hypothetical protein FJW35_12710 [Acidobacteria bacterium]|nr:hypothetical protein [Acidobacteriota bacterium]